MTFFNKYIAALKTPEKFSEQQIIAIDYAKAFGIILVLMGHYPNNVLNYFQPYIFHMPLFFFIGGLLFNPLKNISSILKDICIKYLLYIVVIYTLLAGCNIVLHHLFGLPTRQLFGHGLIDTLKLIANNNFHNNGFFLVGWFLFAYSFVYLISSILIKSIKTVSVLLLPLLLFLCIALSYYGIDYVAIWYHQNGAFYINLLCQILVGSSFYIAGFLIRPVIFKVGSIFILTILMGIFITLSDAGFISPLGMAWSLYPKGYVIAMTGAFLGIMITFSFSTLFSFATSSKVLSTIGRNSKDVMCFHLLVFSLIDCFASCIGIFTIDRNELFTRYTSSYSFLLYMTLGVIFSILIGRTISKITKGVI